MFQEAVKYLRSKTDARLLFCKVWGSRSHNTHHDNSDWDFSGVFIYPTRSLLGLDRLDDNYCSQEKPDCQFHEVGKFANLLIEGNPSILEMLWTDRMTFAEEDWNTLVHNRRRFLSKRAVAQYLGYAEGQLKRIKSGRALHTSGGGYSEKWAYHLLRVLGDSARIIAYGEPVVWKEGPERDFLMSVRRNEIGCEQVIEIADSKILDQRAALEKSGLPDNPDKSWLNEWLVDLRMRN